MDPEKQIRADALTRLCVEHKRLIEARDARDRALVKARDAGCKWASIGLMMGTSLHVAVDRYRTLTDPTRRKRHGP